MRMLEVYRQNLYVASWCIFSTFLIQSCEGTSLYLKLTVLKRRSFFFWGGVFCCDKTGIWLIFSHPAAQHPFSPASHSHTWATQRASSRKLRYPRLYLFFKEPLRVFLQEGKRMNARTVLCTTHWGRVKFCFFSAKKAHKPGLKKSAGRSVLKKNILQFFFEKEALLFKKRESDFWSTWPKPVIKSRERERWAWEIKNFLCSLQQQAVRQINGIEWEQRGSNSN